MIDEIITQTAAEGSDLDFKAELPPTSGLSSTDFPKDVAAMANSGGGTIVYGVTEREKTAAGRVAVELNEVHERTMRSAAVSAISPPVFGLQIDRLGEPGQQVVALTVPATQQPPHLIYRNDYFGAPLRNDADTVWMREPQIEAMYRARFDRLRDRNDALADLYGRMVQGREITTRAWMVAVAAPRSPAVRAERMPRDDARTCFLDAEQAAFSLAASTGGVHPLEHLDTANPRTGLRSWVAPNRPAGTEDWREAWASVGENGSVALCSAVGGHRRSRGERWPGSVVELRSFESALADFFGLLRATSKNLEVAEYDIQIGVEWEGPAPLEFALPDSFMVGHSVAPDGSFPVNFVPVRSSFHADAEDEEFQRRVYDLVLDCVNQAGAAIPSVITLP